MSAGAPVAVDAAAAPATRELRPEIQALRAAAVVGVVVFHLWPNRLTGGYAGVDVFFVISGFLITGHLMREAHRSGSVALARFWARRIRRLLPAATLVLAVTAAATWLWVPRTYWHQYFVEIIASATYWENWRLAAESVDYLGAESAATAVQHYWSLSLEEQFYVVWPLILVGALAVARVRGLRIVKVFAIVLSVILVASFATSIIATEVQPSVAYFATYTRMWEFALGGLLALITHRGFTLGRWWRAALEWGGWLAIAATFVLFTTATPFPGYTAALPALGTVAVIAAGNRRSPLGIIAASRPVQSLGDNSYSIYLWHWPLIVIAPFAINRNLKFVDLLMIAAATYILAVITKRLVEDPVRSSKRLTASTGATYAWGAASVALVVAISVMGLTSTARAVDRTEDRTEELIAEPRACLGAAAVLGDVSDCDDALLRDVLLPEPGAMKEDTGNAYWCYETKPSADLDVCTYGSEDPDALRVAIVGDSHAASLVPGLSALAGEHGWRLDTFVSRGCLWIPTPEDNQCFPHAQALADRFTTGEYDVILVTNRRSQEIPNGEPDPASALHAEAWAPAIEAGTTIVAIADNPTVTVTASTCLEEAASYSEAVPCSMTPEQGWKLNDSLIRAVELAGPGAGLVNMPEAFCTTEACPMVTGHVAVYRDTHHITATYSRTLAPYLMSAIDAVVRDAGATTP